MWTSSRRGGDRRERRANGARDGFDIVVVGPYPPPLGGVSAHVARVVTLLERSTGLKVGVLNHFGSDAAPVVIGALKRNPLRYFAEGRRTRARLFHYHHSRRSVLIAFVLGQRRSDSRFVMTIHGLVAARRLNSRLPLVGRITTWALDRFDRIVVVNPEIESELREHVRPERLLMLPAFVPPTEQEAREYGPEPRAFFASGKVMIVSAYRVQPLSGGRELYGLDLAVDAFLRLAPAEPELKLAVLLARAPSWPRERLFARRLRRRLQEAGFGSRVLWLTGLPLVPALQHDVVLVRPTRHDGDAVSIREALAADVPVVASDVVGRPSGVVTFPSGSLGDLCAAIQSALVALGDPSSRGPRRSAADRHGFAPELLALYRELLVDSSPQPLEPTTP